jgi:hypothetical protein
MLFLDLPPTCTFSYIGHFLILIRLAAFLRNSDKFASEEASREQKQREEKEESKVKGKENQGELQEGRPLSSPLHDDADFEEEVVTNKIPHAANLSVLFLWLLGRHDDAEARAQHELHEHPDDLISLTNLAFILWKKGEHREAEGLVTRLATLREEDDYKKALKNGRKILTQKTS